MMNESVVVFIDLDNFKEISKSQGWNEFSPNIITGTLTALIENLVRKHFGSIIFGLDAARGTEECLMMFSAPDFDLLFDDLEKLRLEVKNLSEKIKSTISVSIGIARGKVLDVKPSTSRKSKHLYTDPIRNLAKKALNEAKKMGGDRIIIK